MFGWRARIGYICPSVFEQIAPDFYRIVPAGVAMIGVTCMIEGWSGAAYQKGLAQIEQCAKELARRQCDFIIHSGVPLVVSQERGFEKQLVRQIEAIAHTPATTSIVAAMAAMGDLGVKRVGLVNPYPQELNDTLVSFLNRQGFDVRAVVSLGANFTRIGDITEADVYRAARRCVSEAGSLDGIYLPCPQFPVLDVIERIETDFGVPAVSHIGSELYIALKTIGVREPIEGFGRLLKILSAETRESQ